MKIKRLLLTLLSPDFFLSPTQQQISGCYREKKGSISKWGFTFQVKQRLGMGIDKGLAPRPCGSSQLWGNGNPWETFCCAQGARGGRRRHIERSSSTRGAVCSRSLFGAATEDPARLNSTFRENFPEGSACPLSIGGMRRILKKNPENYICLVDTMFRAVTMWW